MEQQLRCLMIGMLVLMTMPSKSFAAPDQAHLIRGKLVGGGVICALIKTEQGEILPLAGITHNRFPIGTELELEGEQVTQSICQQGPVAFKVDKVLSINGELQGTQDKN